jgi:glycosyltransferase involved in cell wall biosynthesis
MKVVHVEGGRHLYGGGRQVLYLVDGLGRYGCTSILVCPVGSAIAAPARAIGIDVREVPLRGDHDVLFIARLHALLRRERPDVVHLHSRRGVEILGALAARLAGIPCIYSRRNDNPEFPPWARIKYRLYDRVVTISEGIRGVLLGEGIPADKLVCVPSAVDAAAYDHACDRAWFEREFAVPQRARVLGVIAQLIARKGHRHLLAALPPLLDSYPDLHVLCFGKGPLHRDLSARVAAPPFAGRVRLVGFYEHLPRVLPCLYGVVHPADMEGLGVSLLQAAAAGVPIIASRAGGIPEVVRDGINGWLVPPGDVGALGRAIAKLLDDPARAASMGQAGRAIVRESFSVQAMVEGNWRTYRTVLQNRPSST